MKLASRSCTRKSLQPTLCAPRMLFRLQCVAVHCSVLQCVAAGCRRSLQPTWCALRMLFRLQYGAVCCSVLQRGAANLASHFVLSEDAGLVSACVHVRVCVCIRVLCRCCPGCLICVCVVHACLCMCLRLCALRMMLRFSYVCVCLRSCALEMLLGCVCV